MCLSLGTEVVGCRYDDEEGRGRDQPAAPPPSLLHQLLVLSIHFVVGLLSGASVGDRVAQLLLLE